LFCFGLGYSAQRVARQLADEGWDVVATARTPMAAENIRQQGYQVCDLTDDAQHNVMSALRGSTHLVVSAAPGEHGDPLLHHIAMPKVEGLEELRWIGYLSTVGVYGDSNGEWIDETSPLAATSLRGRRRIAAEEDWLSFAGRHETRLQIFRLAGIYGPGRSAIDKLRDGTAHRIVKPGQVFNRIHVDDIAQSVIAGIRGRGSEQIYNVTDDEPGPPQDVVAHAAELLQMPPPPEVPFDEANLSPMAASFYSDNKRIRNDRLRQDLGVSLKFPTYRDGLRAIVDSVHKT
jgi:nucleoside-diphosphate-sugar epimerase